MLNYFTLLGFEINDLFREDWNNILKKRYRVLTKAFHPDKVAGWDNLPEHISKDKFGDYANNLQTEINKAYEVLSNPEKRNEYLTQMMMSAERHGVFEKSKMQEVLKYASQAQNNSSLSP